MGMTMMRKPKAKLMESLITQEVRNIFDKAGIDPEDYIVYSGLIQVKDVIDKNNLSKDDKIILIKWAIDIENKLSNAEDIMMGTLTNVFDTNPILEVHRGNFPLLDVSEDLKRMREKSIRELNEDLEKLKYD